MAVRLLRLARGFKNEQNGLGLMHTEDVIAYQKFQYCQRNVGMRLVKRRSPRKFSSCHQVHADVLWLPIRLCHVDSIQAMVVCVPTSSPTKLSCITVCVRVPTRTSECTSDIRFGRSRRNKAQSDRYGRNIVTNLVVWSKLMKYSMCYSNLSTSSCSILWKLWCSGVYHPASVSKNRWHYT